MVSALDSENLSVCPIRITEWAPTDKFLVKRRRPMPRASGQSPRGGDHHGTDHTSSRALCVELSELTFSISPISELTFQHPNRGDGLCYYCGGPISACAFQPHNEDKSHKTPHLARPVAGSLNPFKTAVPFWALNCLEFEWCVPNMRLK